MTGSERPSPAPGVEAHARTGGMPGGVKLIAGLVGLGLLVIAGMLIVSSATRSASRTAANVEPAPVDRATRTLAEAKAMIDRGEIEQGHAKAISEIPEDSNARQSQEFREIEARWADMVFDRAAAEADEAKKRAILDRIAKSTTVDSVRRKRAANEIAQLDAEGVDVSDLPSQPVPTAPAAQAKPEQPQAVAAKPAGDGLIIRRDPFAEPGAAKSAAKSAPAPAKINLQEDATSGDRDKALRAKRYLQQKAQGGKASEQEQRMLRALCRQLGDPTCS